MKKILAVLLVLIPAVLSAQKVNEVLEVGPDEIIQGRAKFLLKFNGKTLDYDFWNDEKTRFRPLKDSTLFLSKQNSVSVYRRPVNPLNYSFQSKLEFVPSAISQEADAALEIITKSLTDLVGQAGKENKAAKDAVHKARKAAIDKNKKADTTKIPDPPECSEFTDMVTLVKQIEALLKKDQKGKVKEIFNELKAMTFEKEQLTKAELEKITPELEPLQTDLGDIETKIAQLEVSISNYDCPPPHTDPYIARFVFTSQVMLMKTALKEQKDRYNNLKKCLDLVQKAYSEASESDEGLKWMVAFKVNDDGHNIEVKRKTVSNFLVTVNDGGYKLSDNGEIVAAESKEKSKVLVRVLKFQRFIPEVIPGAAYSFLQFPKFGVNTDTATGKQLVADAGNENFKRINFSAMVNFNFFSPQSSVHPFLQIGVGANTDYPAFFTGGGLRFDIGGGTVKALAISGGMVSTWIKTLKTLKIGDEVKGTADLEKDITHEFKWPPKLYLGIQLKF
jgi:soluble cytochrome b562